MITPEKNKKNEESKYNVSEITAGKEFALKQSRILSEKRFLQVFSREELTKNFQVNWQVFQEEEFDSSVRRESFKRINYNLKKCYYENPFNKEIGKLLDDIKDLVLQEELVHEKRMLKISLDYFRKYYPDYDFKIGYKEGGIQLGSNLIFYPPKHNSNLKETKYFLKTHEKGTKRSNSSEAKPINSLELLAYKIIEKLGIGCETHLFGIDLCNYYIATRDAGEDGTYLNYWELKFNSKKFADLLNSEAFFKSILYIDLLSHILRLRDLLTNHENFGFIKRSDVLWEAKIIDFHTPLYKHIYGLKADEKYIRNYIEGRAEYVISAGETIVQLMEKEKSPIKKRLKEMLENQLKNFEIIVEKSYEDVLKSISDNIVIKPSEDELKTITIELQYYSKTILDTYDIFLKQSKMIELEKQMEIETILESENSMRLDFH